MKSILLLAVFVVAAYAYTEREYQTMFTDWMQLYQKSYHHDQFRARYQIWKDNLGFIDAHNADSTKTFKVAMNQFGDLTLAEFTSTYMGFKQPSGPLPGEIFQPKHAIQALPATWDWRTKGAVTAIKNQEQCGSCWSFSTTGSTEGCHQISTGNLVALSEQNLMDCSYSQGDQSCEGGLMTDAMNYIIQNGGIDTEASYPYLAQDESTCNYQSSNSGATLKSYTNVQSGSESDLQTAVYQGPTSVAIDASQSSFQFYSSGVYYEPNCSSTQLDHGVLAIGWGIDSGAQYWLVKNSWGTSWGMNGFIEMSRNRNNNCGIATMATLPSC
jgi:cathepsin L